MKKNFLLCMFMLCVNSYCYSINFTTQLKELDGKPIVIAKDMPPLTLSDVCVNALETPLDTDKQMSGQEKFKLDQIARKIYNGKNIDLTVEEISTIKERVGKAYGPMIVGQVWKLLDPSQK